MAVHWQNVGLKGELNCLVNPSCFNCLGFLFYMYLEFVFGSVSFTKNKQLPSLNEPLSRVTNTVSERFISAPIFCIVSSESF